MKKILKACAYSIVLILSILITNFNSFGAAKIYIETDNLDGIYENIISARSNKDEIKIKILDSLNYGFLEAAKNHDMSKTLEFLESGVNINCSNLTKETALIIAAKKLSHSTDFINLLITRGADINAQTIYGDTALLEAIDARNSVAIEFLIKKGANVNIANISGITPLIKAIKNESYDLLEMLIDAGADVNQASVFGDTPLMYACSSNRDDMVELLIYYGAKVNAVNKAKHSAIFRTENPEIIESLINNGANIDDKDKRGNTPLIWATIKGNAQLVMTLVKLGANINHNNNLGKNTVKYALENNGPKIARLLMHLSKDNDQKKYIKKALIFKYLKKRAKSRLHIKKLAKNNLLRIMPWLS